MRKPKISAPALRSPGCVHPAARENTLHIFDNGTIIKKRKRSSTDIEVDTPQQRVNRNLLPKLSTGIHKSPKRRASTSLSWRRWTRRSIKLFDKQIIRIELSQPSPGIPEYLWNQKVFLKEFEDEWYSIYWQ